MREIFLAKKGKRMLAKLIDLLILVIVTSVIYFPFIYPNVFDSTRVQQNSLEINQLFEDTGLFIVDEQGNYSGKSGLGTYRTLDDLYSNDFYYNGVHYEEVFLTETLEDFYLNKFSEYGGQQNLTLDIYKTDVLQVGTIESNIASYNEVDHTLTMIDEDNLSITLQFFLQQYDSACQTVITDSRVGELQEENQRLFLGALSYILIVLFVVSLIFDLIIPLILPFGQSIGKLIFKIGVVSKDGYRLKKGWLVTRFIGYFFIELILGIVSFGGIFLISYTMFLFQKRRRCIHDYFGKSCVIDLTRSIIFDSPKEEEYFKQRATMRSQDEESS